MQQATFVNQSNVDIALISRAFVPPCMRICKAIYPNRTLASITPVALGPVIEVKLQSEP